MTDGLVNKVHLLLRLYPPPLNPCAAWGEEKSKEGWLEIFTKPLLLADYLIPYEATNS